MKPLKIMSLPVDDGGGGWYRVYQPFSEIKKHTIHDTHVANMEKDDLVQLGKAIELADIIVMRYGAERVLPLLGGKLKTKAKTVIDIDDNSEMTSPYSSHYKDSGVEEFFDKNQNKWLWKDGESGFDLKLNRQKVQGLIDSMRIVDMVTVTTPKLAEYARQYNKNVAILPNCINHDVWWKLPFKENIKPRIGWSGGISHYEDFYSIKKPLSKIIKKYKPTMVIAGNGFKGVLSPELQKSVEEHAWVPFQGHSYRMMAMNLDLAIIPLADLPFNHYKSPIKYFEMSAMGVPSIVPNISPYKEVIDNKRAFIYNDEAGFYKALKFAINSPKKRKEIGKNAQKWVLENRDSKKNVDKWISAYSSLL